MEEEHNYQIKEINLNQIKMIMILEEEFPICQIINMIFQIMIKNF